MDSNLRELIEMATVNGNISSEHEKLIIEKAIAQGMSETEIRLYIDNSLRKNSSTKKTNIPVNTSLNNDKVDFKTLSIGDWIILIGTLITAISGFFPWITASVSSSGFGQSYSSGASSNLGLMYSIPIAVSAFAVFYSKKLHKYLLYEGLGIVFIGVSLLFYYSSSTSASGGGFYSNASTKAGTGVIIMIIGGIIYSIGVFLRNKVNIDKNIFLKIIFHHLTRIIILGLLITIPLLFEWDNYLDKSELLFAVVILGIIPFLISKKSKYEKFNAVSIITLAVWVIALLSITDSDNRFFENLSTSFITIAPAYFIFNFIAGGLALIADYYSIQNKQFDLVKKLGPLFNYKLILGLFITIFLVLFTYNVTTKHKVSYDELNAYTERNGIARGDWYFLSEDSSSIFEMSINFNVNSLSDNGDVKHNFSASLYNNLISLEGINSQQLEEIKEYDYEITYPISFDKGLKIDSVQADKLSGSFILKGNTLKFEAYRDQSYLNNLIEQRNNRIANMTSSLDTSSTFINEDGIMITISPDLYMINDPDGFTNLRDSPDGNIIRQIYNTERFV